MSEQTLSEAIDHLKHQESYKLVLAEIEGLLEVALNDLDTSDTGNMSRIAGKIGTYREVISVLSGE
jgi:hypothetical protein